MSSNDQQNIDPDDVSVAELLEQQRALADRVDELEDELQEERQARQDLSRALAEIEISVEEETQKIRNKYDRRTFNTREDLFELEERIDAIERGEVDPGEVVANSNAGVDPSDLLPLHNMYLSSQNLEPDEHDLSPNQEIASRLFPYLGQYAFSNEGKMVLPSTKVKDILEREIATPELAQRLDVENPNPNTVRRAMKFVGQFGKDMMEFDTSEKTNRIVIDRDAWKDYTQEVTEIASGTNDSAVNSTDDAVNAEDTAEDDMDGVENEFDQLTESSDYGVVSTDGGTAVNSNTGR